MGLRGLLLLVVVVVLHIRGLIAACIVIRLEVTKEALVKEVI